MKSMSGIRATSRTRKAWPDKLCANTGCGCLFSAKPTYHASGKERKYCSPSCSAEAWRNRGFATLKAQIGGREA